MVDATAVDRAVRGTVVPVEERLAGAGPVARVEAPHGVVDRAADEVARPCLVVPLEPRSAAAGPVGVVVREGVAESAAGPVAGHVCLVPSVLSGNTQTKSFRSIS